MMSIDAATGFTLYAPAPARRPHGPRLGTRWLDADTAVVTAEGEIDASNANILSTCAFEVIPQARRVVIDLGDLKFLGSQGLLEIARLSEAFRAAGVRWVLVAGPAAARMLRAAPLRAEIETVGSFDAALDRLEGRRLMLVTR